MACNISLKSLKSSVAGKKNNFHMRQMTLSSLSSTSGQVRQTLSAQAAGTKLRGRYMTSASKSLELLRLNIQSVLNQEIDAVIKKYLDKFFRPAIENIRNNLGENSVTEDNIRMVCRQILEDAKIQYRSDTRGMLPYSGSETSSIGDFRLEPVASRNPLPLFNTKRKESDIDLEASQSLVKPKKKAIRGNANLMPGVPAPIKLMKLESIKKEGPKWDPNRIVKSTLFIMGARANKVLGFGQTRGRLYTKHPELLKYSGDAEDKEWLSRNNLMPPTGGIAYLLLLEDVKELAESDEYRHNPNVLLGDLKGFEAPDFMLKKIRAFIAQARTDAKDHSNFAFANDQFNDVSNHNYNADCASVVMTLPAGARDSVSVTSCESSDPTDFPSSFPVQGHEFFPSAVQNFMYEGFYQESSKPNHSQPYSSGFATCGDIANHRSVPPLLLSQMGNQNLHEDI